MSFEFLKFFQTLLVKRGKSLLLLFISVGLPSIIFGQLAIAIRENSAGFPWDREIMLSIHATATPAWDQFAIHFTDLGVFWGVFPVAAITSYFLYQHQRWRAIVYLIITLLGSWLISYTTKLILQRPRPSFWEVTSLPSDYSFPSGHALLSMSLVAALMVITWGSRWQGWVLVIGGIYAITIGWTRLYLGVHFPSDVLAGWMVAIAWATGVNWVIRPRRFWKQQVVEVDNDIK
jgi:membrane-associated phospholipid phosphatase